MSLMALLQAHIHTPEMEEDIFENGEVERTWTCSDPECNKVLKVSSSHGPTWVADD